MFLYKNKKKYLMVFIGVINKSLYLIRKIVIMVRGRTSGQHKNKTKIQT